MNLRALAFILVIPCLAFAAAAPTATEVKLHGLFTDNMVLQRGMPIAVFGTAKGGEVVVTLEKDSATAKVDANGHWRAELPARQAGGPYTLIVAAADKTVTLKNIMLGEVWILSGQSNMELHLRELKDPQAEIAAAKHDDIRFYNVEKAYSKTPLEDVRGAWTVCTPETAKEFSAVGYFFGRELTQKLKVTIGLINAPWWASPAEAWTTPQTLNANEILAPTLRKYWPGLTGKLLTDQDAASKEYEQAMATWWKAHPEAHEAFHHDIGNRGQELGWHKQDFNDASWTGFELPKMWTGIIQSDGAVWFRRQIAIPPAWAGKELELSLGPIRDFDVTYFNGRQVGATGGEGKPDASGIPRLYRVPAEIVKEGPAVIAVRIFGQRGGGGFGAEERGLTISLVGAKPSAGADYWKDTADWHMLRGGWKHKVERPLDPNDLKPFPKDMPYPVFVKEDCPQICSYVLFNAMIHPLLGYGFQGAAWYQGESNGDRGEQYRTLLPAMINDWRKGAGREFPFLIVQLPTYGGGTGWAEVREAQAMTAQQLPKVGMAVIMDIWDGDLHPKIKLPVGQRLALQALSVAYGQKIVAGGPVYKSMVIDGPKVRLKFDSIGGGLTINNAAPGMPKDRQSTELRGFSLGGSDGKFYPAKAKIEGDTIVLLTEYVPYPMAARYCFADGACDGNLCNAEGLPCGTFRTDDWPVQTTGKR